jgi:hypothetical protein
MGLCGGVVAAQFGQLGAAGGDDDPGKPAWQPPAGLIQPG